MCMVGVCEGEICVIATLLFKNGLYYINFNALLDMLP